MRMRPRKRWWCAPCRRPAPNEWATVAQVYITMDESKGRGLGEPASAALAIEWRVYNRLVPVLDANTLDVLSHGADQTQRLGSRLGELLQPGDVVCLAGDLGSGKTQL